MLGGRPGASMLDDLLTLGRLSYARQPSYARRPSYIGTTFLNLDDTMDKLEIVQLLVHHQLPPVSKGRPEHCGIIVCF